MIIVLVWMVQVFLDEFQLTLHYFGVEVLDCLGALRAIRLIGMVPAVTFIILTLTLLNRRRLV